METLSESVLLRSDLRAGVCTGVRAGLCARLRSGLRTGSDDVLRAGRQVLPPPLLVRRGRAGDRRADGQLLRRADRRRAERDDGGVVGDRERHAEGGGRRFGIDVRFDTRSLTAAASGMTAVAGEGRLVRAWLGQ